MKSYTLLFFLLVGQLLLAQASSAPVSAVERQAINQTMKLSGRLDLSNEESQRLMAVILEKNQEQQALYQQSKGGEGMADLQTKLEALAQQREEAIAAVLTPEQLEQWEWAKTKTRWKGYYRQGKQYWLLGLGLLLGGLLGWGVARRRYLG